MGRDSTGKRQEAAALSSNTAAQKTAQTGQNKSLDTQQSDIDSLAQTPGYTPQDITAMRAEGGDQINAVYGNQNTQLRNNAAQTGYANDAGLYSQLQATDQTRARDAAMLNNNVASQQANQVLNTRRALPGYQSSVGQQYGTTAQGYGNQNTSLITNRNTVDQQQPLWAQLATTAMGGAAQAGSAAIKACWIAAEVFDGWLDPRTILVREWLYHDFGRGFAGRLIVKAYERYGEGIAKWLHEHPRAKQAFRWLFERALAKAKVWKAGK